ncbi:hypothetical protein DPMN_056922 [Dreissena polymorpha]|uniref:Uncharacterized protein n=1 Tax=Dreissena polymorpha TaxID=45954 RepID=A0A9D4CU77_DREPO|nr:hypothetical protein DPMN_056922 [Dreissena polymorpha]
MIFSTRKKESLYFLRRECLPDLEPGGPGFDTHYGRGFFWLGNIGVQRKVLGSIPIVAGDFSGWVPLAPNVKNPPCVSDVPQMSWQQEIRGRISQLEVVYVAGFGIRRTYTALLYELAFIATR